MTEPITIDPSPPLDPGLDYTFLQAEGTALVQQLCGETWTDYNESDPGVTALEQLCYALTELSYRAQIPIADLLTRRGSRTIQPRRQALFIPRRIFPVNPVTADDYRKLLIDRVAAVRNAWLEPYRGPRSARGLNGLYELWVYAPGIRDPLCQLEDREEVRQQAERVYNHHRGLCEDLEAVRVLKPVATRVFGRVELEGSACADNVLADLLFRLDELFAPEPKRHSLDRWVELGIPPAEIFDGPLLLNGFIDDDELRPKATEIPVWSVASAMAATPGVAGLSEVAVQVAGDEQIYRGGDEIPVPRSRVLVLVPEAKRGGQFTVRLFQGGVEVRPDPARVRRQLDRRWREQRRTYPLNHQYQELFGLPEGRPQDLRRYFSVQSQFPAVYGIGEYGLPGDATTERRAQARQLKGYLLAYDQMLADFFAQLSRAKDLFSIDPDLDETYFFQYLDRSVPDVEPLLGDGVENADYREGLPRLVHSQGASGERRSRFLDFLLALYAESLGASQLSEVDACPRTRREEQPWIDAKLELLRQLVVSTRDRGRGFDVMGSFSQRNTAGMEIKSRIQLGLTSPPLAEVLDTHSLEIVEAGHGASLGRRLRRHADHIEEHFVPVPPPEAEDEADAAAEVTSSGIETVSEELLAVAGDLDSYRLGKLPDDESVAVVCRAPEGSGWYLLAKLADFRRAAVFARRTAERLCAVGHSRRQLYIVEHLLLRYGQASHEPVGDNNTLDQVHRLEDLMDPEPPEMPEPESGSPFEYSSTITAVLSAGSEQLDSREFRRFAREVLRENAPAHIVVELCFLSPRQMGRFEDLYWPWRQALRSWSRSRGGKGDDWRRLVRASAKLREFLARYEHGPPKKKPLPPPEAI